MWPPPCSSYPNKSLGSSDSREWGKSVFLDGKNTKADKVRALEIPSVETAWLQKDVKLFSSRELVSSRLCSRQEYQTRPLLKMLLQAWSITDNSFNLSNNTATFRAGETAEWSRAVTALAGDLGLVPSTCMMAHSCLGLQF